MSRIDTIVHKLTTRETLLRIRSGRYAHVPKYIIRQMGVLFIVSNDIISNAILTEVGGNVHTVTRSALVVTFDIRAKLETLKIDTICLDRMVLHSDSFLNYAQCELGLEVILF